MGFGPPEGDPAFETRSRRRRRRGAMTFALPGTVGDYAADRSARFVHQELIEILYHTLWETVHVFFEHRELGLDSGPAGILYPFLGTEGLDSEELVDDVARRSSRRQATSNGCARRSRRTEAEAIAARAAIDEGGCGAAAS